MEWHYVREWSVDVCSSIAEIDAAAELLHCADSAERSRNGGPVISHAELLHHANPSERSRNGGPVSRKNVKRWIRPCSCARAVIAGKLFGLDIAAQTTLFAPLS